MPICALINTKFHDHASSRSRDTEKGCARLNGLTCVKRFADGTLTTTEFKQNTSTRSRDTEKWCAREHVRMSLSPHPDLCEVRTYSTAKYTTGLSTFGWAVPGLWLREQFRHSSRSTCCLPPPPPPHPPKPNERYLTVNGVAKIDL